MEGEESICDEVPGLLSEFVDAFVDFSVSDGLFLPPTNNGVADSPTRLPEAERLVAIGDVHGDLEKTEQSLRLSGIIDSSNRWSGGSATVIQIGDVLDRGGEEIKILYFLERLKREAIANGGNLITMNGNHEIMNVEGDFRYATKSGLKEFEDWAFWYTMGLKMKNIALDGADDIFKGIPTSFPGVKPEFHNGIRARIAALRPKGPVTERFLAKNTTVAVIGGSVFVHGGLLKEHVEYGLERMNSEVREWMSGGRPAGGRAAPGYCRGRDSVVWLRRFSDEAAKNCDCEALERALSAIPGARRMIMGHTIQEAGINGVCGGKAIRIDVGMSKGCINGLPEVLEIIKGHGLRVLTSNPAYQTHANPSIVTRHGMQTPTPTPVRVSA